jgi:hypothetical protein
MLSTIGMKTSCAHHSTYIVAVAATIVRAMLRTLTSVSAVVVDSTP